MDFVLISAKIVSILIINDMQSCGWYRYFDGRVRFTSLLEFSKPKY